MRLGALVGLNAQHVSAGAALAGRDADNRVALENLFPVRIGCHLTLYDALGNRHDVKLGAHKVVNFKYDGPS